MSIRWKFFLFVSLIFTAVLLIIFGIYTYIDMRNIKEESIKVGKFKTEGFVILLRDFLYYGDYDSVVRIIEHVHVSNVVDVIVMDREGFIIGTKRRGLVLFEKFENFERIRGISDIVVQEKEEVINFYSPILLGEDLLGYIALVYDKRTFEELIFSNLKLYSSIFLISLLIFYVFAFAISSYIHGYIRVANSLLEDISSGILDIPDPPRTGDEFESLFKGIKETAERLKEVLVSRDFYLAVINTLKEGILILDKDFRIIESNKAVFELCKYTTKDIKGKHIKEVFPVLYKGIVNSSEKGIPERLILKVKDRKYVEVKFTEYEDMLILTITDVTEKVLEEQRLKEMAERDPLTGIYNRRALNRFLEEFLHKFRIYGEKFSVIMFDIDHFKRINDTFGHDVGDYVLKEVVNVTKRCIRKQDIFGRWGGEEFLIILPYTTLDVAVKVAERIRTSLEFHTFEKVGKVTASFGVTEVKVEDTIESLIRRADEALYRAKRKGRNRVESA